MKLTGFMTWADDIMNPIAVKEMRQAVKGRSLGWVLMIFIAVQLTVVGGAVLLDESAAEDFDTGRNVFMVLQAILLGTCLLFLPIFTALRISSERSDNNVDLLYITTLRPTQIIWGKFFTGLILTLLFFSASMPFMTLTYLLRGLDMGAMFFTLGMSFVAVIVCIMVSILLACPGGGLVGRGIRFLIGLGALAAAFFMVVGITRGFIDGYMYFGSFWDFWGPILTMLGITALGTGLLFILSATIITPPSANKALGGRLYLLLIWLATGALVWLWYREIKEAEVFYVWGVMMAILFAASLLVASCERFHLGPRVLRTIPRKKIFRLPTFLFYSGASRGSVFAAVMIGLTFLVVLMVPRSHGRGWDLNFYRDTVKLMSMVGLYTFAYTMTALFIRRIFFKDNHSPQLGLVIAVGLFVVLTVIPTLIGLMFKPEHRTSIDAMWYIANPLVMATYSGFWTRLAGSAINFSAIWSIIALVINMPWIFEDIKRFKPLRKVQAQEAVIGLTAENTGESDEV
ncbi:ABC-type transport system involved in multi-copper enzyme maturation, permease component [Anaerohalosphaera lusitana]|uniref:ABC-type transport system involved in multi-copper enzyme maturation, permease component n=1 Tax=Anaerohalosphaera lusitana TaxID=1936003 RepID=A0A1U9NL57_9BACT|nr:ABC transporter permease [Anaerohalosphaera lusitana]AQT68464.1 ABC-type transport system involved in multi-copper enzyme maturation, permease component [Anaerohalosphaera lusitana]